MDADDTALARILEELIFLVDHARAEAIEYVWIYRNHFMHGIERGDLRVLRAYKRELL